MNKSLRQGSLEETERLSFHFKGANWEAAMTT